MGSSVAEQGLHELLRIESRQVVGLFPDADEFDGNLELLADRNDHTSLRGSVEFGQDDPGALHCFREAFRLTDAVLTGRRIQDQQDFVRCILDLFLDDPADLGQLVHQIRLGLQIGRPCR